ncbi:unnamed protein product, partial [Sphagnum compactum]
LPNRSAQAISARSDGDTREGHPQRSPSTIAHLDISTRATTSAVEATGRPSLTQVLPKQSPSFPRISKSFSTIVGQRPDQESLGAAAARQVAREDISAARAKELSERSESRKKSTTPTTAPPNPTLITHSGSGPGTTLSTGGDIQARKERKRSSRTRSKSNSPTSTNSSEMQERLPSWQANS